MVRSRFSGIRRWSRGLGTGLGVEGGTERWSVVGYLSGYINIVSGVIGEMANVLFEMWLEILRELEYSNNRF